MRRPSPAGGTLAAVAAGLALAAAPARAVEFEPEEEAGPRSLALGPLPSGGAQVAADLGYVRSGLRADLGLAGGLDLGLRFEAFTTRHGLSGQKGVYAGARWSPLSGDGLRASLTGEAGFVLVPVVAGDRDLFVMRAELAVGHFVSGVLPYARAAVRGLRWDTNGVSGWDSDFELAGGVERALGRRVILGAEVSTWLQPGLRGLAQWRVRAGLAF